METPGKDEYLIQRVADNADTQGIVGFRCWKCSRGAKLLRQEHWHSEEYVQVSFGESKEITSFPPIYDHANKVPVRNQDLEGTL